MVRVSRNLFVWQCKSVWLYYCLEKCCGSGSEGSASLCLIMQGPKPVECYEFYFLNGSFKCLIIKRKWKRYTIGVIFICFKCFTKYNSDVNPDTHQHKKWDPDPHRIVLDLIPHSVEEKQNVMIQHYRGYIRYFNPRCCILDSYIINRS